MKIDQFRKIVDDRQLGKVDGQPVDLFSASVVVQVHDALKPETQALMETMTVAKIVSVCFRLANR